MKYSRLILCAVAALLAVSCAQENLFDGDFDNASVTAATVTFSATTEVPEDASRTGLKDETSVVWTKGDAVALFTAKTKDRFDLQEGAGTTSATFSGTTVGEAPFYAFYPYSDESVLKDGAIEFKLPSTQDFTNKSFSAGASPSIATTADLAAGAVFKNVCGILQVNLCGSGSIRKVEVINLSGAPLWGDCRLLLDGKQGTSEQTLTVTGGSNRLMMDLGKDVTLLASSPRVLNFVVPAGSFSKGFSVRVYDSKGKVISFLTAQSPVVEVSRSNITVMEKLKIPSNGEPLDPRARGYHKEVFMDGGSYVTSRTTLPAVPYLGWDMDFMATDDSVFQRSIVIKNELDDNGYLLYPDNQPRYRMIYCNGGKAASHGRSLTSTGRTRYKTFVNNGGAYVGSCAGAFLASYGTAEGSYNSNYLAIYPGPMFSSGLTDAYTGMFIPENSALLNYGYNYGNDFYVDSVRHNGGGYVTEATLPANGEILATFDRPDKKMHKNGSIWAYKANEVKGRVLTTGSHPEGVTSGERRDLMAAMMLYATDGNGVPSVKGDLKNGELRSMDATASDGRSGFACIGDNQYHHFTVTIPENTTNFKLELQSPTDANLFLALRKDDVAWLSDADFLLVQGGSDKVLEIPFLPAGTWYVSVYCAEVVTATCAVDKFEVDGAVEALMGIEYSITASWTN